MSKYFPHTQLFHIYVYIVDNFKIDAESKVLTSNEAIHKFGRKCH